MAAVITNIGRGIKKSFSGLIGFFRGCASELKKVKWPDRKEMKNYTLVVLSTIIFLTIFFFIVDMGIGQLVQWIIE